MTATSPSNSKRVLLTGIGGAIGVHVLAHIMHNTDWEVVGIDSFKTDHKGYFDRVTRVCRDHPDWPPRLKLVTHDLTAPFTDRELRDIGTVDYIINLAARSDVQNSIDDPTPFIRNNTEIMLTMLDAAQKLLFPIRDIAGKIIGYDGVFIQFSTDEVYGPAPKDSKGHKEWSPIIPSNPYSASKAMQEDMAIAAWRSFCLPLIITNTMNNFGEMQAPSKFPAMIQQKLERDEVIQVHATPDGEIGSRYYIHSRNVADALLFILKNVPAKRHSAGEIDKPVRLNIVGDRQINNLELVGIIADLMHKEPKVEMANFHENNPGHDLHYGLDGTLLAELGWKSPLSLEESMKNTIEWQQRNPEWMK